MKKSHAIQTFLFSTITTFLIGCSPRVDYKGIVKYPFFGSTFSTEVEISCKDKKARVIGSGEPNQGLDRVEEVSQNWRKIDEIEQNVNRQLKTSQKSGLTGGTLEILALSLQQAIQSQYDEICN